MTPDKLLLLIKAWQEDSCPGEILFDALLDYGYDPDANIPYLGYSIKNNQVGTIRNHLFGEPSNPLTSCSRIPSWRKNCGVILRIKSEIEAEIASKNAPFTGENTPAAAS